MEGQTPQKKKSLSTAGFICSLCGFITCGITSIVGLVLSIIGLSNSKKEGQSDGLAIAGIVIGALPIALGIIFVMVGIGSSANEEVKSNDNSINETTKDTTKQEETTNKTPTSNERFTIIEHYKSDESNSFAMYIEGKIKNNRNKSYSYVQVTFTTYDVEGNVIGSCMDNINNLDANGTWKFKAICLEDPDIIDHYELKEISGW